MRERRARLAVRHRLAAAARAGDVVDVAESMVALHATDPASVFLAAWARMRAAEVGAIERALYDDRLLVRLLGMRRTMFVVPVDLVPVVHAACVQAIAVQERRKLVQLLEQAGVADDAAGWLQEVAESTLLALASRRQATGAELSKDPRRPWSGAVRPLGQPGPTVWWDGRIVGGWAQRKHGEIAVRLLEDVGAAAVAAVDAAAARLRAWMGEIRVTPRFRTPLERELSA